MELDRPAAEATDIQAQKEDTDLSRSLEALFFAANAPGGYVFCEADPETGVCEDPDDGLSATGVGGTLLPLLLDLSEISVDEVNVDPAGWSFRSRFHTRVNGIPPQCVRSTARVTINDNGSANIVYGRFYCFWAVIGHVVTRFEMSVDRVDPTDGSFAGYYALGFNGTGNADGSGYYRATPVDANPAGS